uniref:Uncharacterized protein n=1 Tax=Escherichia coli TaxID=562 RepID=G1BWP4_ECOLX|nr:unknown [Escherichia coli]
MNPLSISRCFRLYFLQRLICSFAGKTEAHYLPVMGLILFIPPASNLIAYLRDRSARRSLLLRRTAATRGTNSKSEEAQM